MRNGALNVVPEPVGRIVLVVVVRIVAVGDSVPEPDQRIRPGDLEEERSVLVAQPDQILADDLDLALDDRPKRRVRAEVSRAPALNAVPDQPGGVDDLPDEMFMSW